MSVGKRSSCGSSLLLRSVVAKPGRRPPAPGTPPCWAAMYWASSLTKPSSAEPRVCRRERPRKESPRRRSRPARAAAAALVEDRRSIHEWSGRYRWPRRRRRRRAVPSSKPTRDPPRSTRVAMQLDAAAARRGGLDPISVSRRHPAPDARVGPCGAPRSGEPPEQVAAEQALRQRRLARADREVTRAAGRAPSAIWKPVLPPPTTSTRPSGGTRAAVGGAVHLYDLRRRRPPANDGVYGAWNGPVATTTWSASRPRDSSTKPPRRAQRAHRGPVDRQLETGA